MLINNRSSQICIEKEQRERESKQMPCQKWKLMEDRGTHTNTSTNSAARQQSAPVNGQT